MLCNLQAQRQPQLEERIIKRRGLQLAATVCLGKNKLTLARLAAGNQ